MSPYQVRYISKLSAMAESLVGCACAFCGASEQLEYAHLTPNHIRGRGRGAQSRLRDIVNNPTNYVRLCRPCHLVFDKPKGGIIYVNIDGRKRLFGGLFA